MDPREIVMDYHEQTKHHYHRFARSLGYLDWANQPDPFRRFSDTRVVSLPLLDPAAAPKYDDIFVPGAVRAVSVDRDSISRLFRNSLAVSAWKHYAESRWALRVNPSSGNLHPTEGYLIIGDVSSELTAGVYHYASQIHALEERAAIKPELFGELAKHFPGGSFFVGFTSIHWREAWKYGERGYRYCQHDLGHAVASMRISAAVLGWQMVLLDECSDQDVALLLGLDAAENFEEAEDEHPHCIAVVIPSNEKLEASAVLDPEVMDSFANCKWMGKANRLSESHVEWPVIAAVAEASTKPRTPVRCEGSGPPCRLHLRRSPGAESLIQQRRSAVAMDGSTSLSSTAFFAMLSSVVSEENNIPFDAFVRSELAIPRIHLAIVVHRVTGIDPGLYFLLRNRSAISRIRANTHANFLWQQVPDCPADLPLYCLLQGDFRRVAASVSCGQDIAADGAFAIGMIAEFEAPLRSIGAWMYPRLFWEAGCVGQILYLEAEAAGVRSTGIGCYFDDPMHGLLGFKDAAFQSLYHFSVGGPVEDERISTEPPYGERKH